MQTTLVDEVIHTDYGQLDLVWQAGAGFDGDFDRFFHGQVNGLVGAADPGGVYLNLARRSGGSRVILQRHDTEPSLPPDRYEDVVAVSVTIPDGSTVSWASWAGETSGDIDDLGPGSYRMRVAAHGRDAGRDGEFEDDVVDDYLLQLWPAAPVTDEILRVGSKDAEYWHREVGSRR